MKEIEDVVLKMWDEPFTDVIKQLQKQFHITKEHAVELVTMILEKEYE